LKQSGLHILINYQIYLKDKFQQDVF
jgi:hypothetical protein